MNNWTEPEMDEVLSELCSRAANDEVFRARCNNDIHEVIKEISGREVPASFKIKVIDNTGYHLSVTLPDLEKTNHELSDSELEKVAGGNKDEYSGLDSTIRYPRKQI